LSRRTPLSSPSLINVIQINEMLDRWIYILPFLVLFAQIWVGQKAEARPYPDSLGICYLFQGDMLDLIQPCVISQGYGTGEHYTILHWSNGKKTTILTNVLTEQHAVTVDGEKAESYTRDSSWYNLVDKPDSDDDLIFCERILATDNSICYKTNFTQSSQSTNKSLFEQCNTIIEVVNETVNKARQILDNTQFSTSESMWETVETMNNAAKKMESLSLNDPTLLNYQSRYVTMYRNMSQAMREFAVAFERRDRDAAEVAQQSLQSATNPEQTLTDSLNNYCQP